jgi:hypothetical protein
VAKHIQRFKRIINWAVELGWVKTNPLYNYSCPVKKSKRKKLTIQVSVKLGSMRLIEFIKSQLSKDTQLGDARKRLLLQGAFKGTVRVNLDKQEIIA